MHVVMQTSSNLEERKTALAHFSSTLILKRHWFAIDAQTNIAEYFFYSKNNHSEVLFGHSTVQDSYYKNIIAQAQKCTWINNLKSFLIAPPVCYCVSFPVSHKYMWTSSCLACQWVAFDKYPFPWMFCFEVSHIPLPCICRRFSCSSCKDDTCRCRLVRIWRCMRSGPKSCSINGNFFSCKLCRGLTGLKLCLAHSVMFSMQPWTPSSSMCWIWVLCKCNQLPSTTIRFQVFQQLTMSSFYHSGSAVANVISQFFLAGFLFILIYCGGMHKPTWSGESSSIFLIFNFL